MGKNQRYSKYRTSRYGPAWGGSSRPSNPVIVGVALVLGVVLAALCGRSIDERLRLVTAKVGQHDGAGQGNDWTDGRAGLRIQSSEQPEADAARAKVIARIEKLSGVSGASPFSPEKWVAKDTVTLDGIDVSGLLTQDFTLKRSLEPGYHLKSFTLGADFRTPGSFFDIESGSGKNGVVILRITEAGVSQLFRSPSGITVVQQKVEVATEKRCEAFVVDVKVDGSTIQCRRQNGESAIILSANFVNEGPERLVVATNLVASEINELKVSGAIGSVESEDGA